MPRPPRRRKIGKGVYWNLNSKGYVTSTTKKVKGGATKNYSKKGLTLTRSSKDIYSRVFVPNKLKPFRFKKAAIKRVKPPRASRKLVGTASRRRAGLNAGASRGGGGLLLLIILSFFIALPLITTTAAYSSVVLIGAWICAEVVSAWQTYAAGRADQAIEDEDEDEDEEWLRLRRAELEHTGLAGELKWYDERIAELSDKKLYEATVSSPSEIAEPEQEVDLLRFPVRAALRVGVVSMVVVGLGLFFVNPRWLTTIDLFIARNMWFGWQWAPFPVYGALAVSGVVGTVAALITWLLDEEG